MWSKLTLVFFVLGALIVSRVDAQAATTVAPTTVAPTTVAPTTVAPTTVAPTTVAPTTVAPTTVASVTEAPTTVAPTTVAPTTVAPTTVAPTTVAPTTVAPTTVAPTTVAPTTVASVTEAATTVAATTVAQATTAPAPGYPSNRVAFCPALLYTIQQCYRVQSRIVKCAQHSDCASDQLCCRTGCGYTCRKKAYTKSGLCPSNTFLSGLPSLGSLGGFGTLGGLPLNSFVSLASRSSFNYGSAMGMINSLYPSTNVKCSVKVCGADSECNADMKCCNNGCSCLRSVMLMSYLPRRQTLANMFLTG